MLREVLVLIPAVPADERPADEDLQIKGLRVQALWGFRKIGYLCGGPYTRDYSIFGVYRVPLFWEIPISLF